MKNKQIQSFSTIKSFNKDQWDRCNSEGNIFLSYNFLNLLEESNSISKETGWKPIYFGLFENNQLLVCCACFIKTHSQGEYVFDHSWANAYSSLGLRYYPKVLIASPFSPVSGIRILVNPSSNLENKDILIKEIIKYCKENNFSGLHVNFFDKKELLFFKNHNFLIRLGEQFHFINQNYISFDDFLRSLSYKKRKSIINERKSIVDKDIKIKVFENETIDKSICKKMYQFYLSTIEKKWSYNYLTEDFFFMLPNYLKENVVIIAALENGEIIAAALNFISRNTLYGRYWGAEKHIPNLHFEVCFYKAIEYAISKKLKRVEAGAQGLHKVKRGYLPIYTYSAHMLFDKRLSVAVANFLEEEGKLVDKDINLIKEKLSPYKH